MSNSSWLLDPNSNPVILLDCYHANGVRRLSTQPFVTRIDDDPANVIYDDLISGGLTLSAAVDSRIGVAEIEFFSFEDEHLLEWGLYVAWLGDMSWAFVQFYPVMSGTVERALRPARNKIRLELADPAPLLDAPILSERVNDALIPLALGIVFNATPIVINAASRVYRANSLPCTITAVRDSGLPVGYTDNGNGTFTLAINPAGDITCDIAEQHDTVPSSCNYIAQRYGLTVTDTINFESFQNTAKIGLYISDQSTGIDALRQIAQSIGAFVRFNEFGELQLVYMPTITPSSIVEMELYTDDIEQDGFRQNAVIDPSNITLYYRPNYTLQSNLAGAVSADNRALYARDSTAIDVDNDAKKTEVFYTLLANAADAQTEADRIATRFSQAREYWEFDVLLPAINAKLGDVVSVEIDEIISGVGVVTEWTKRPDRKKARLQILI